MQLPPKTFREKLALFFAAMGPGIITAFADNDAGGIATYISAGAKYGYALLSVLLISTICLGVMQEISARIGIVTGKGLFVLIRERYGKRWAVFVMILFLVANIGTTASEFSAIVLGCAFFSISKYIAVPFVAFFIWLLVVKANYNYVEKVFFLLCATFFSYIFAGILVEPSWTDVMKAAFVPAFYQNRDYFFTAIGIIGTTITPWGQFYMQAAIVDKGITVKEYRYTCIDIFVGTFFTGLIAFFILITTATALYGHPDVIENVEEAAIALEPFAGAYASILFNVGLLGAALLAAVILPLSTAYAICEVMGLSHGINKTYQEAPTFFMLYTVLILLGAGVVFVPNLSLYNIMLLSQVLNGVLLPPILIFILLLSRDDKIMGSHKNTGVYYIFAWIFTILIIALTVLLLIQLFVA
ncbi:MAG: natural resistance-associated macrophage protein [Firmicutes bacterium]|nr:natural resistance-associated macrophage protein [Bacillota bacterium]